MSGRRGRRGSGNGSRNVDGLDGLDGWLVDGLGSINGGLVGWLMFLEQPSLFVCLIIFCLLNQAWPC